MALDASVPHDFGHQWVGAVAEWPFILHNAASAADTLRVEAVEVAPPYGVSMESFKLAPSGSQQVLVTYAPTQPGFFAQTLVLRSNDPDSPATIRLWGTAVSRAAKMILSASASFYNFGTVFARADEAWTLEVGNTGPDTLWVEVRTSRIGSLFYQPPCRRAAISRKTDVGALNQRRMVSRARSRR